MTNFSDFLSDNINQLIGLIGTHITLTVTAVVIAILVGVPLGIFIASQKGVDKPILGFTNIMQAIPSLAALGLLVPIIGIGAPPAILMVVLYSLLPIVRNTYTGIKGVNPQMIEAAHGIGMTKMQVLFKIKFPVALPVIMSGVRISSVTAVGLMTIASYIGAGGLGNFIISGIQMNNVYMMLSAAIPACILALSMDFLMNKVEKAVTPISMSMKPSEITPKTIEKQRGKKRTTLAVTGAVVFLLLGSLILPLVTPSAEPIVVGSKPVPESQILGNIIAELIEQNTDLEVERQLSFGMSTAIYEGLERGDVDIYPEYSGSLYAEIFGQVFVPGTPPEQVAQDVRDLLADEGYLYSQEYGLNNRYTLGMLPETAEKYRIETISDLAALDKEFVLSCSEIFPHRADGAPALETVYGLEFAEFLQFQGVLMYEALISGEVEIMTPYSTDAMTKKYNITILEDDLSAFSHYTMSSVFGPRVIEEYPEVIEVLKVLEDGISDEEMMDMNYKAVVDGVTPENVAKEFIIEKGWVAPY